MKHRFKITVERLDTEADPATNADRLTFEAESHDDILALVDVMKSRGSFGTSSSAAMVVGLKLFGSVMLANRNHPLFSGFAPHFGAFMKTLKASPMQYNNP